MNDPAEGRPRLARLREALSRAAGTKALCAALLAALALAAYGGALRGAFVYDDDSFVVLNKSIRSLSDWPGFFRDPATLASDAELAHDNYRPLTTLSYALNYAAGGLDPFGYHLLNLLLHLAASWLLFLYAAMLLRRRAETGPPAEAAAFLAAAIFLIHPVQVESVTWISGRANLLAVFFVLAALLVRRRGAGGRAAALALGAAALLSKELGVVLPALVLLEEGFFGEERPRRRLSALAAAVPYAALAAAYLVLRSAMLGRVGQTGYWAGSFRLTQLTMARAWLTYARLLVWPNPLSLEYLFPVEHRALSAQVIGAAALAAAAVAAAWRARARRPALSFGLALIAVGLLPTSNLIPLKAIMAERFLYLSVAGFALALADAWRRAASRRAAAALATAAVLVLTGLTARRAQDWTDPATLIQATLRTCPQSARMHYGLGRAYAAAGRYAEAAEQFRICLLIDPSYEEAARDVGRALYDAELDGPSLRAYRSTLQTRINEPDALFEFGSAALKAGEFDVAVEALSGARRLVPARADVASNLSAALAGAGRLDEAAALARGILRGHPREEKVRRNLALYEDALARAAPALLRERFPSVGERLADAATEFSSVEQRLPDGRRRAGLRPADEEPGAVLTPEKRALLALARRERGALPRVFYADVDGGVELEVGGLAIAMEPLYGQGLSRARVQGGLLVYPAVRPGLDVLFAHAPGESEKLYLLRSAQSAPLSYRLTADAGVADVRADRGGLSVVSSRPGEAGLALTAPVVIDARGRRAPARYALAGAGERRWTMTLEFDDRGLRYPLLIDPTWTTNGASTMTTARQQHTVTLLPSGQVLVAGGVSGGTALATAELYDPVAGTWSPTGAMSSARYSHTATLLMNGDVLVVGGNGGAGALSTAELYDPLTGSWSTTTSYPSAVMSHTATLLADSRVLVAGGSTGAAALNTGAVYNPSGATWTAVTGTMLSAVSNHVASLLTNNRVLIAGGETFAGVAQSTATLYDPATNSFLTTGGLIHARYNHIGARLSSGLVLVAGGWAAGAALNTSETYNPATGVWTATTGNLVHARENHVAALLPSGQVVIAGGDAAAANLNTAETYSPTTGNWTATGTNLSVARTLSGGTLLADGKFIVAGGTTTAASNVVDLLDLSMAAAWTLSSNNMASTRSAPTATLLPNGKVLVAGGTTNGAGNVALATADLYNPATNSFAATGSMASARGGHTASILPNGNVLIAGGAANMTAGAPWKTCEIYISSAGIFRATGSMNVAREIHTSTLMNNGKVLVTGGYDPTQGSPTLSTAEYYDPNTEQWTLTNPMNVPRVNHSASILFNGDVLIVGGQTTYGSGALSTVELYNPVTSSFTFAASMSTTRGNVETLLMSNGNVIALGGNDNGGAFLATTEIYNPQTGTWALSGNMSIARAQPTGTLLPNGKVMAAGGVTTGNTVIANVDIFDPASGLWSAATALNTARVNQTATLLQNGSVLQAGGWNGGGNGINTAESASYTEYGFQNFNPSQQPLIATVGGLAAGSTSIILLPGASYTITGSSFTGASDAAGGSGASGANLPHLILRGNDTGTTPPQEQSAEFVDLSTSIYAHALSSTTLTIDIPSVIGFGHYQMFVISNAVISTGVEVGVFPNLPSVVPTGVTFLPPGNDTSLVVNWTTAYEGDVSGFLIRASTAANLSGTLYFASVPGNPTTSSGTISGLSPNTTYFVEVAAENISGLGSYSSPAVSTATLSLPLSATGYAQVNVSSVAVSWAPLAAAPSSMTAEGYVLDWSTSAVFAAPVTSSSTAVVSVGTLTATGLTADTTYFFELFTQNWNGLLDGIVVGSTMTLPVPPSVVSPAFTNILSSSFTVNWSSGSPALGYNGPAAVYAVQVSSVAAFTGLVFSTRTVGLSVPMTGLWPNTTYFAEVAIFSGGSTKTYVALGSSSTLALPPTPSFLGISTNSVSVDWIKYNTAVASDSAEGFELIASTAPNFTGTLFSSATPNGASATLSTLTVSGLAMLTTYYLEVGSVNWAGTTNYALVGSTLTADIIPPITVLSASTGPLVDTVSLDWTTTGVQNGAGVLNNGNFIIEYTTVTAFAQSAAWTPNGAIPAFVSSVTISTTAISPGSLSTDTLSGLISGDTYYIRVYEEDFGGYFSGLSLGATAYATPAFYALSLSTNVISLSMNAPSITSVTAAIIVTNIGNIGTTVQLSLTNPAFWTATASTPTADNFRVTGIFTSVLPSSTTFSAAADLISTTTMTASATTYAIVADPAGVKGFNIAPSATRNLFLRVELPVYTSTTTAQFILLNAVPGP